MGRLSFLLDEHVPRVFRTVLSSKGFEIITAQERFGQQSVDASLLEAAREEDFVIVTNDRDFLALSDDHNHAGIILYTDRSLLLDDPVGAVEAIAAIDRYYAPEEMYNVVEWLDNWQ